MRDNWVVITGSSGEIGQALTKKFLEQGYSVLGLDINPPSKIIPSMYWPFDLLAFATDERFSKNAKNKISEFCKCHTVSLLINNAAIQIIDQGNFNDIKNFQISYSVNTVAPYGLYRLFYPSLAKNKGSMINIGSVHSLLSKKGFTSYAASKASLRSLTKTLAIENQGAVRLFSVEPGAVKTSMLMAGFKDKATYSQLKNYHPSGDIATPLEIANFISLLFSSNSMFLHGSTIDFNGGISSVLHDPA